MKQPIGVFMVGWEYPPHNSGGLGVACQGLTQALAEQNTQIYFTLPYATGFSASHMDILDCSIGIVGPNDSQPPFFVYQAFTVSQPKQHASPQSYLEEKVSEYSEKVMDQALLYRTSDVIHAHDWMSFPAATQASQKLDKPFVAQIHSTEYDRIPVGNGSQFIKQTEYEGLMAATRVIAVSYYTKELLIAKYGIPRDKISVVHNGIAPLQVPATAQTSPFKTKRPVVTFMGRLTMQKGTEFFLQLAQSVLKQIPNALFIMAGDGDLYHELLWKVADQQLTASVLFSGFVRDTQRELLLDRSDVFVMPSVSEPFGLVALEAAQRNTPVIVSQQSGVHETLPSALVADFWDIEKMTEQVVGLLHNQQNHAKQVATQQKEVANTTWKQAAERVTAVYRAAFLGR